MEKKVNKIENPSSDQKVCFNCKHIRWLVGIGQGVKCKLDFKIIDSRYHTCDKFEMKIKIDKNK